MPDELTTLREELAALRAELAALKKSHHRLLDRLMELPNDDDYETWPDYLHLEASSLCIRNHRMRIPIIMQADDDGATIGFYDEKHCQRLELASSKTGAHLELRNPEHQLSFQLIGAPDGSGQLCVCDPEGRPRAGMRVNEFGGVVNVVDKESKPQVILIGTEEGGEVFAVNAAHKASATMKATARGGHISVHEPSGQLMAFLSADTEAGCVTVYGPHGEQAASLIGSEAGGRAVFHDVEGKPTTHLP